MLLVKDSKTDLEVTLVIPTRPDGRGTITLSHGDLAGTHLTRHDGTVEVSLIIASFGKAVPLMHHVATLTVEDGAGQQPPETPVRYAAKPEITHTFRQAETMPPVLVSVVFSMTLAAGFIVLLGVWVSMDVNVAGAATAVRSAPVAYTLFLASLFAMEVSLFLYWSRWRIMQALGTIAVLAVPTFFSGRFALREVEKRRLAGTR